MFMKSSYCWILQRLRLYQGIGRDKEGESVLEGGSVLMDHGSKERWETVVGKGQYKGNEEMIEKLALLLKKMDNYQHNL